MKFKLKKTSHCDEMHGHNLPTSSHPAFFFTTLGWFLNPTQKRSSGARLALHFIKGTNWWVQYGFQRQTSSHGNTITEWPKDMLANTEAETPTPMSYCITWIHLGIRSSFLFPWILTIRQTRFELSQATFVCGSCRAPQREVAAKEKWQDLIHDTPLQQASKNIKELFPSFKVYTVTVNHFKELLYKYSIRILIQKKTTPRTSKVLELISSESPRISPSSQSHVVKPPPAPSAAQLLAPSIGLAAAANKF